MQPEDAKDFIRQGISVTRQEIVIAKHFVVKYAFSGVNETGDVVDSFLRQVGALVERSPKTLQQETGDWEVGHRSGFTQRRTLRKQAFNPEYLRESRCSSTWYRATDAGALPSSRRGAAPQK